MILLLLINLVYVNKTIRTILTTKNPNKYYVFQGVFELENPGIKHLDQLIHFLNNQKLKKLIHFGAKNKNNKMKLFLEKNRKNIIDMN